MPDQNKPFPPPTISSMSTTKHLLNTLPSYISLYTTSSQTTLPSSTRNTILKWYSTLSPPTRLSHLTILHPSFTNILLQMLSLSSRSSHVTFLLLPDLPSSRDPTLPSLCHRTSHGLLSRVADTSLREFVTLFSSHVDGERLDTVSFKEGLVEDVGRFVEVMDGVSGGRFLNGEEREWEEVGREWGEMSWLREKGYYSLEEFVVNRIEIALRSAWLSCNGGGGRRGKGRKGGKVRSESGVGANVFWRKRGCVEWWERLGKEMRRKVFMTVFSKAAKAMVLFLLNGWFCFCCVFWNLENYIDNVKEYTWRPPDYF